MSAPNEDNNSKRPQRMLRNNSKGDLITMSYTTRNNNKLDDSNQQSVEEAAAMILSSVDSGSYEKAAALDSERILHRHVFPKSFVWNQPRIQVLRTLPRDIEDMPGVLCADTFSQYLNSTVNNGPVGFGMFDLGGIQHDLDESRGSKSDAIVNNQTPSGDRDIMLSPSKHRQVDSNSDANDDNCEYPLQCSTSFEAGSRRSYDPGMIELAVKLPLLNLESALLNCQRHHILPQDPWLKHEKWAIEKAKALLVAEQAEISSSMPFYYDKLHKKNYKHPPTFIDDQVHGNQEKLYQSSLDYPGMPTMDKDSIHQITKQRLKRKIKLTKAANQCIRKWRLSVKVGGVSSRSAIVNNQKKKLVPMHLIASFPSYFQTGKSVTLEMAQKLDEESKLYLGSYDCRASAPHASMSYQATQNIKKENRSKKINVGRTRLIWSNFHQAGNNKIVCTSCLTGERLDTSSAKRPLKAKVYIRFNGAIISTADESKQVETPSNGGKKSKLDEVLKWNNEEIDDAIESVSIEIKSQDTKAEESTAYKNNAFCFFQTDEYLQSLTAHLKQKPPKPSSTGKKKVPKLSIESDPITLVLQEGRKFIYTPSKIISLPLDDGYIRTVCHKPGHIFPTSVHELLKSVSETNASGNLCCVCWCGDDKFDVLSCKDCGLKAHKQCCSDRSVSSPWRCSICLYIKKNPEQKRKQTDEDDQTFTSRKSQRMSRLPTRFKENTQVESATILRQTNTLIDMNSSPMKSTRYSPQCTLCPHSGGAMSVLKQNGESEWTHEICRIWCTRKKEPEITQIRSPPSKTSSSKKSKSASNHKSPSSTPALASLSTPITTLKTKPAGDFINIQDMKKNPVHQICCLCGFDEKSTTNQEYFGLIKCAAVGCHVMFHPMCATLVTKLRAESATIAQGQSKVSSRLDDYYTIKDISKLHKMNDEAIEEDLERTKDFTLDLLEVKFKKSIYDKENDKEKADDSTLYMVRDGSKQDEKEQNENDMDYKIIPIGFCGIHNPKRTESLYGCPNNGQFKEKFSSYMKIPYHTIADS